MEITITLILNLLIGIMIGALGIVTLSLGNNLWSTRLFSILTMTISLWSIESTVHLAIIDQSSQSIFWASLLTKSGYVLATVIASTFILFAFSYADNKIPTKKLLMILLLVSIFIAYLVIYTNTLISAPVISAKENYISWTFGPFWYMFDIYFVGCWISGFILIYKKYTLTIDPKIKSHLKFLLLTFVIGVLPPIIVSMTLPHLGIFDYDWLGQFSGLIWFLFISYSITRHRLFNIRVIATQIGVYTLWIFMTVRMLMTTSRHEMFIDASFLITAIIMGVLLIKNTMNVIRQEEHIKSLNTKLETTMSHTGRPDDKNML